jgi:aminoglycoside phosphotransferase (APT) family kinase protein
MGFIEGRTIRTQGDLASLGDGAIDECIDGLLQALVSLHQVDFQRVGLTGFGRADSYASRQLRRWSGQWTIVSTDRSEAAEELVRRLQEAVPDQAHASIVHGDFRIDNTLIAPKSPGTVTAIVDWELSTIGDPSADVAMMCAYRHPALDLVLGAPAAWTSNRIPTPDTLAARYESLSGTRLQHWDFYLALAYYKLAVIAQGISHRHRAGASTDNGFATAGDAVEEFLRAGLGASARLRGAAQR